MDVVTANLIWFEYFSTMLASKGAPYFRSRFLEFVIEELKGEVNIIEGKNKGLNEDVILKFFGAAIVGITESF
ncbi:hypothetical protein ABEY41_12000 [Peribacillus butanolivorans]|uniref:hypothetical protein n=1 Tax=Peribacillus butanolivorans TaxID=421767 RepID=UPI003D2CBC22